jgi:centromeric protein E
MSSFLSNERSKQKQQQQQQQQQHIEVCVRLRPMVVEMNTSSSSFFHDNNYNNNNNNNTSNNNNHSRNGIHYMSGTISSSQRKSSIPRPGSASSNSISTTNIANRYLSSIQQQQQNKPISPDSTGSSNVPSLPTVNSYNHNNTPSPAPTYAWSVQGDDTVIQNPSCGVELIVGRTYSYTLDHVYGPDITTQSIYTNSIRDRVYAAMNGYHAAILAYGQTATGKTHTMTGTIDEPGFIPLAIRECFSYIKSSSKKNNTCSSEYLLRLSYLEVYKEHIKDLLAPTTTTMSSSDQQQQPAQPPIRLYENTKNGTLQIRGIQEIVVTSPEQVFTILADGESRRQVGSTHSNQHSSRSHVIVRIWIESRTISIDTTDTNKSKTSSVQQQPSKESVRVSSLSLVDLAGSESVRLTGSSERRTEGHYINKSLMTLGQVVYALSEQSENSNNNGLVKKHVPYRDSKLTRLLQPSLSGNAQVVLLCCISPLSTHIEESHNTFKFAIRAKKIPQKAIIQEHTSTDELTLLQSYRAEIEDLKQQLKDAQELMLQNRSFAQTASLDSVDEEYTMNDNMNDDNVDDDQEMQELIDAIQKMEKLILKTQPISSLSDDNENDDDMLDISSPGTNNETLTVHHNRNKTADIESRLLALTVNPDPIIVSNERKSSPLPPQKLQPFTSNVSPYHNNRYQTPPRNQHNKNKNSNTSIPNDLHQELARIQGLLGSVMKKRQRNNMMNGGGSTTTTSATEEEVRSLRAALEQQEVVTSLRQADSSFLQAQLEEKDNLLMEVSKLLETVEERQLALENENMQLRNELNEYKKKHQQQQQQQSATN